MRGIIEPFSTTTYAYYSLRRCERDSGLSQVMRGCEWKIPVLSFSGLTREGHWGTMTLWETSLDTASNAYSKCVCASYLLVKFCRKNAKPWKCKINSVNFGLLWADYCMYGWAQKSEPFSLTPTATYRNQSKFKKNNLINANSALNTFTKRTLGNNSFLRL